MVKISKEETIKKVNLRKEQVQEISLGMGAEGSRVAVVLDYSGSMKKLYENGSVQRVLERLLPIAMQFDDNGEMEVWLFSDSYKRIKNINLDNCYEYIENNIDLSGMYGTNYCPVINDVVRKYTNEDPSNNPVYVIFITDGDCFDKVDSEKALRAASYLPIFWQFVGLGACGNFGFLQKLDDMKGRFVDNADFFRINDFESVTDGELYKRLLNEYPGWLKIRPRLNENNYIENTGEAQKKKGFFRRLFGK